MTWTSDIAARVGTQESGLKLILGQLSGYPIFLFYRHFLKRSDARVQHLYFFLTGLLMAWWAIGQEAVMHACICVVTTFVVLKFVGTTFHTSLALSIFNMAYLFIGYWYNASRDYDITWTMPQCVLCLRLIGLSMDCWDGTKWDEDLSKDQLRSRIKEMPNLLEMFSHTFFIGGYFVGPQFSMTKYKNFIDRNINETDLQSPVEFGFRRLGLGILYMLGHLIGSRFVPENWIMSTDFQTSSFLRASFLAWIWVKVILAKYIAAWLIAEGSCILSGLSYNGKDEITGEILWNGGANVKLRRFESCYKFQHLIDSFNINTNGWVLSYVYKRLRFLNDKKLSQLGTLLFLAIWHGYHSGYYVTFFYEFIVMWVENEFLSVAGKSEALRNFTNHVVGNYVSKIVGFVYVQLLLPHCFLPFALLKRDKYVAVIRSTNYFLIIYFVVGLIVTSLLRKVLAVKKPSEVKKEQ